MDVWAAVGETPVVRVDPHRTKPHCSGMLDLQTVREIVTRSEVMKSAAIATHPQTILDIYSERPILLLWDRAPWHGGAAVRPVLADNPRLEVVRLPMAAPDLNPQEHVWKATRRATSHHHAVPQLPALADQFEVHLRTTTFPSSFLNKYGYYCVCPMFH